MYYAEKYPEHKDELLMIIQQTSVMIEYMNEHYPSDHYASVKLRNKFILIFKYQ